jgi:hypothetical protein
MQLTKGNKAITEHKKDDKILMLFESADYDDRHYMGEFEYVDYYEKKILDKNNNMRKGIKFRLKEIK